MLQEENPCLSYGWGSGVTPGYGDRVIFGAGTFIDGSTAELTADGPIREPFTVYCQGGTHWTHWMLVLQEIVASLRLEGPEGSN
jgi:cystathionine beta-lyase family protein involved in aluminum resistance